LVALLVTYPYGTLSVLTLLYLFCIPISYRRFQRKLQEPAVAAEAASARVGEERREGAPLGETQH
jgi:CDP-alcohol phosphatidyltransferase 2